MNTATRVQFLDWAVCIPYSSKTLGKGMNPIISLQLCIIKWAKLAL